MPSHAVMLLAALYLGSAPAPLPSSKGDLKKMQGTWALVSVTDGGVRCPLRRWRCG